jgi:hypothetical protein
VRAEQLPDDAHVLGLVDVNQDDRKIARDPVCPQRLGAPGVARQGLRGGPERPVGVEEPAREALEEVGLVGPDAEVVLLNLSLRPRQGRRPVEGPGIVILLGQFEGFGA